MKKKIYEYLNPDFGYFYTYDKTLVKKKTKFQDMKLIHTNEFGNVLLLDNITQVVEKNEFLYHEPMVHPTLLSVKNPSDVLVIGGGDGGIVREVLKHPSVSHVDHVDIDGDVFEFSKKYLKKVAGKAFSDKRVTQVVGDGRAFTKEHPGSYDNVIMDMTDPFGPSRMLYTKEFFKEVEASFKKKSMGTFTMHVESPIARPKVFNMIVKTLESVFNHVTIHYIYIQMYATFWAIAVCANHTRVQSLSAAKADSLLAQRKIKGLKAVNGETISSMKVEFPYIKDIRKIKSGIITDRNPDISEIEIN
jgi:spermidine synthase